MGFYIETPVAHGKVQYLIDHHDARVVQKPQSLLEVPDDKALVVVVDNGFFEAAGYAYDEREFAAFSGPEDDRPKTWLLLDKGFVQDATGYAGRS